VVLSVRTQLVEGGAHELHFSITDTGIGIPLEAQTRLFQSFTQVDASTTRKYGGTGLGLAISKRLAELMGGRMWVESEPGKGSTFHFTVRPEWLGTGPRRFTGYDRPKLDGRRILVVDDSSTSRRILASLTERWGLVAEILEGPDEALARLQSNGPAFDLAVLDMQMPGMDGVMLAKAIRNLPQGKKLPLLLLTSIGRHPSTDEEPDLFANVINKPAKPAQIYDALCAALASAHPFAGVQPIVAKAETEVESRAERILLAEDNSVNQKVALHMLNRLGYRADAVANGFEVLEAIGRSPYDIILMDVQMPEMDGIEATQRIRKEFVQAGRPWIIALTANAMEGDRDRCLAAGMNDYLSKPMKSADLAQALTRAREAIGKTDPFEKK
ncbi:MAG: response regulator, partial [Cephaloticoccus sp.]|nr:response regulator [Cephaloticoccus sp.]